MATPRVVETLNVLCDREGGRRPSPPSVAVDELVFDRREEALADGIIPFQVPAEALARWERNKGVRGHP
jgi:hypothetical protein